MRNISNSRCPRGPPAGLQRTGTRSPCCEKSFCAEKNASKTSLPRFAQHHHLEDRLLSILIGSRGKSNRLRQNDCTSATSRTRSLANVPPSTQAAFTRISIQLL